MSVRTWREQKTFERRTRAEWMQGLSDLGYTRMAAANMVGMGATQFNNMAVNLDVTFKVSKHAAKNVLTTAYLRDAIKRGLSRSDVAREVGVTTASVSYICKRDGITFPKKTTR